MRFIIGELPTSSQFVIEFSAGSMTEALRDLDRRLATANIDQGGWLLEPRHYPGRYWYVTRTPPRAGFHTCIAWHGPSDALRPPIEAAEGFTYDRKSQTSVLITRDLGAGHIRFRGGSESAAISVRRALKEPDGNAGDFGGVLFRQRLIQPQVWYLWLEPGTPVNVLLSAAWSLGGTWVPGLPPTQSVEGLLRVQSTWDSAPGVGSRQVTITHQNSPDPDAIFVVQTPNGCASAPEHP